VPSVVDRILSEKVVGVVRVGDAATAVRASYALFEGGVTIVEIPTTVNGFARAIKELVGRGDVAVGAASVLTRADALAAAEAGAGFIVSPCFVEDVASVARQSGVSYIPAGATPQEILRLSGMGFGLVKVFPVRHLGGPAFIRSLLAVAPGLRLMATGGVTDKEVREYLLAGAVAVGIGGSLLPRGLIESESWSRIAAIASEVMRRARGFQ